MSAGTVFVQRFLENNSRFQTCSEMLVESVSACTECVRAPT